MKHLVHLVGSVPLDSSSAVFKLAGDVLGQHLCRLTDGETGERSHWIRWQFAKLADCAQLETVANTGPTAAMLPELISLRPGIQVTDIELGPLGYSTSAIESFTDFQKNKQSGHLASDCRFMVALPTPLAPVQFYVAEKDRAIVEQAYEAALLRELNEIVSAIPATELAIQWDTAVEFGILEGVFKSHLNDPEIDIVERLIRIGNTVPNAIELGYHLCYGDSGHKHFTEPKDTALLVQVANKLAGRLQRDLHWIHMPVPVERSDVEYFMPLKSLTLARNTQLYLGLVHDTDGLRGTQQRIRAAQSVVSNFGIATECGFGRRPTESIEPLLQLHADACAQT